MRGKEGGKKRGSNAQREIWGTTVKGNKVSGKGRRGEKYKERITV